MNYKFFNKLVFESFYFLLLLSALFLSIFLYSAFPFTYGDMEIYLRMAHAPMSFAGPIFGFRVGQPLLVNFFSSILSIDIKITFFAITTLQTFLAAILLVFWLRINGVTKNTSTFLACAYLLSYPGSFTLTSWALIDASLHFFLMLGLIFIHFRKWMLLGITLLVGGLFKENVAILLAPTFVVLINEDDKLQNIKIMTGLLIAFAVSFFVTRSGLYFGRFLDPAILKSPYSADYFSYVFAYWGGLYSFLAKIFYVFTIYWISLVFFAWRILRQRLHLLFYLFSVIAQIPFATDIERMINMAFPVVFLVMGLSCLKIKSFYRYILIFSLPGTYFFIKTDLSIKNQ